MIRTPKNLPARSYATCVLFGLAPALVLGLPVTSSAAPPAVGLLAANLFGQDQHGTIRGRLVWGGDQIPQPVVLEAVGKAQKDPNVCARTQPIMSREMVVDPKTRGVAYAFAYLVRPQGDYQKAVKDLLARQPKVEIDQKNCEFQPYVLGMHKDQTLVFKASDPMINHNVRLSGFGASNSLNQILPPNGKLELHLDPERLPIKVGCDIHSWMKCFVLVVDHPFFTTTGTDGSFEIKNVPAGTQHLVLWQEQAGYRTTTGRGMAVEVKAGETTDVGDVKLVIQKQ